MNGAREVDIATLHRSSQKSSAGVGAHSSLARCCCVALAAALPSSTWASIFQGDTLDYVANIIAWVALVVGPIVVIAVFWLVHILPEKIAEKRRHPQAKAIQTLCLLSLFFGGLLWPIAWLWAYTKPVLHKMAYGTDVVEHEGHPADGVHAPEGAPTADAASEPSRLRMKVVDSAETPTIDTSPGRERA